MEVLVHIIKSGLKFLLPLFSEMFRLLSNEVNFSDKDSAIKLGAIIRIDFFVINFNAKSLSLL